MVTFPNAKINLGLRVTRKRYDGYHDLETIFLPIGTHDALEIMPAPDLQEPLLTETGLTVEGDPTQHLCRKAWQLLKSEYAELPAVRMHLHKHIPMGAGMGGGSADGAFTLLMLNDIFHLGITNERLAEQALQLGSDCPFFIHNKPCLATGRGEHLSPVNCELLNFELLVVHPGVHVSTKQAFAGVKPNDEGPSLADLVQSPISTWRSSIRNDFEASVFIAQPVIGRIKDMLYDHGAVYAAMTGSGSAVYGLFNKGKVPSIPSEPGWRVFQPALLT